MKKYLYIVAAVSALVLTVSCKEKPVESIEPVFPEAITQQLEPGGSYTLTIEPNLDWVLELKYEEVSTGWFWIQDGNSQAYSLRGKAGEKVDVTVATGTQMDPDKVHSCTLELIMGEKSAVIATFTRATSSRNFSLAYCEMDEEGYDFKYSEDDADGDLMYAYNEPLAGEDRVIPMVWNGRTKDYRRSILIVADFAWQLKSKPEWLLTLKETEGAAGVKVEVEIEGDPTKYPLEDATSELVFCAKDNMDATFVYDVKIPGCGDIFEISGFEAETKANREGGIYYERMGTGSWTPAETGLSGNILGINGAQVFKFAKNGSAWVADASWVVTTLSDWVSDAGVLQERELNIRLTVNESEAEREALILVMPAKVAPADASSIIAGGQVAEKYADYVVTKITQSNEAKGMVYPLSIENFGSDGEAVFTVLEDEALNEKYGTKEAYTLTYNSHYSAGPNSNLDAVFAVSSWTAYDKDGNVMEGESAWLNVNTDVNKDMSLNAFLIEMDDTKLEDKTAENIGYIILSSTEGAQVTIKCVYKEYAPAEGEVVFFEKPNYSGAILEHVTSENKAEMKEKYKHIQNFSNSTRTLDKDIEEDFGQCNIYILTYTSASPSNVKLDISKNTFATSQIMPWGIEWLTASEEKNKKFVTITMEDPGKDNVYGVYQMYANNKVLTEIFCIPAF